jgi:hypothetical protein
METTMSIRRRTFLSIAPALVGLPAYAQTAVGYPNRPVKLLIPFPPGQGADIFGRMIAERLSQKWGQNVVVENKAGGAGVPGMVRGCPKFCVNGQMAGNCRTSRKMKHDRKQRIDRPATCWLQKA